jgi:hypothetical protein
MLPPHIAEHSPRDLEPGCVDSVLALERRMFGIRAECEQRCVWCRFSAPQQRTLVSQHEGTRKTRLHIARRTVTCTNKAVRSGSNLYIFHLHLFSLEWQASGVIALWGRVHSPTNDSVNHSWSNLGECIRRCVEVTLSICRPENVDEGIRNICKQKWQVIFY